MTSSSELRKKSPGSRLRISKQSQRTRMATKINVPSQELYLYAPVQNYAKFGYSISEQNAVLYALGRILANYGHELSETINHNIKSAIFNYRQLSLFD